MVIEDAVQLLGLGPGAREPVQDEAVRGPVVGVELFLDDADDDVVGDQEAAVHEPLGLEAERGAGARGLPEQVSGREVVDAVVLGHADRLGSLARTLLSEQHQAGTAHGDASLRQGSLHSCAS